MYSKIVAINDAWVKPGMDHQVLDADSRYYGGVSDDENGIAWPNHSVGTPATMAIWAAALVNPNSIYYRNEDVLIRLELAAQYMLRVQHEDGSISPGWTNFHSPPDTAFVVVGYAQVYQLLVGSDWLELRRVTDAMRLFLEQTIPVMLTGGCHTPNHRWVLCAALGFLHELFDLPEALVRAEAWMAEGLDGTPDGKWTERSNGIYNAVSDIMLIHAARLLNHPELLEPVRRNLHMMVYLVHPDGEVVTEYSGRQDFGVKLNLSSYLLPYAMLATEDEDVIFEAMAVAAIQVSEGPVDCMTQISFVFGREGKFTCGEYRLVNETVQCWTGGTARYESGNAWFELTGTAMEHKATSVRGAAHPMDCYTLLVNWMAPFNKTISIRMSPLPVSEV